MQLIQMNNLAELIALLPEKLKGRIAGEIEPVVSFRLERHVGNSFLWSNSIFGL
jgi:hypothetical protein